MLRDRLRTSAILIAIVAGILYLDVAFPVWGADGIWLLPLLLFLTVGTAWDFTGLLIGSGRLVSRRGTVIATAAIALSAAIPMLWGLARTEYPINCPVGRLGWIAVGGIAAAFGILIGEMFRYGRGPGGAVERASHGFFVTFYVGLPMAMLVALRNLGDGRWGLMALITMIAVTKSSDAGAYFTGKSIGKNKLIPRLSPGKTREGSVGGIIASTLVAWLCLRFLMPQTGHPAGTASINFLTNPLIGALILGPSLAIAGMTGDLAESLVKRDTGAKDSGSWLPGLGGVWDVTDSLIAAVTPAYLCFAAGIGW